MNKINHVTALKEMIEALRPFAKMDREGCNLDELACVRGTASSMTIITSEDFRRARLVLEKYLIGD